MRAAVVINTTGVIGSCHGARGCVFNDVLSWSYAFRRFVSGRSATSMSDVVRVVVPPTEAEEVVLAMRKASALTNMFAQRINALNLWCIQMSRTMAEFDASLCRLAMRIEHNDVTSRLEDGVYSPSYGGASAGALVSDSSTASVVYSDDEEEGGGTA